MFKIDKNCVFVYNVGFSFSQDHVMCPKLMTGNC